MPHPSKREQPAERPPRVDAALPPIDASPSAIAAAIFLRGAAPRPPEPEDSEEAATSTSSDSGLPA